ncbi:hypothetical protein Bbelb_030380 [Branchiostoma belcheri]|nr:hypothetical protein Bbelb_030380 [Branchiostoma belcheri]
MDVKVFDKTLPARGVIITKDQGKSVPPIVGMNVIGPCRDALFKEFGRGYSDKIETGSGRQWQRVLKAHEQNLNLASPSGRVCFARAPCRQKVTVPARHEIIVYCNVRGSKTPYTALVEPAVSHNLNASLVVARSYVEVRNGKAPVRIANLSKQDVQIAYNTVVAELSVVELVPRIEDDISLERESEDTVRVCFQHNVDATSAPESWFPDGLDLSQADLADDQKQKLGELLAKHKNAFSTGPYDVGHTTVLEHDIPTGDAAPIREPYRRIPPTLYQDVREQIQKLQDSGIIRESTSPWGAGLVLVKKKDGSVRFCCDYRRLNEVTHKQSFPLPRVEESLEALGNAKVFSSLDLSSGFWQVPVKEEDKGKTAFVTPWGAWEWERMPMGLASSPSTFQRVMMKCLGDQNLNFLLIYQDDILVYSDSFDSHLEKLEFVLTRLEQHGLKLKPSKCNLCQKEVRYLGHVVSEEGVATDPDKIAVVRDWPVPATVKQLRSFLGFAGYYRRFVQGYAQIAACLHELVGGQGKAQNRTTLEGWSDKHRQAFDTLKQKLTSAPILACPDYAKDMILYVDACDYGYGAVLSQVQEGVERVIAYASKGLGSAEKSPHNYSSFKLELAGLHWAICKKFKEHLYGVRFTVFTDNNPLAHLHNAKLGAVEQRWVAQMAAFDFDIKYRPGRVNINADALSRLPMRTPLDAQETVMPEVVKAACQRYVPPTKPDVAEQLRQWQRDDVISQVPPGESHDDITRKAPPGEPAPDLPSQTTTEMGQMQQEDPTISRAMKYVSRRRRPDQHERRQESAETLRLLNQFDRLEMQEGVLVRTRIDDSDGRLKKQIILPPELRLQMFQHLHSDAGHLGINRIQRLMERRFYWPNMHADIASWVKTCKRCVLRKTPAKATPAPLVPIKTTYPLELVAMDYLTVDKSSSGYEYILVIIDHYTKYAVAVATRNQSAETTARALWTNFVVHYGFPHRIHTDKGANFLSNTMQELCRMYGAVRSNTTPYHPQGNGLCERFNKTLLDLLGTLERDKKKRWPEYLAEVVHAYNCTEQESTGYSPFYLMFGRHPRLPVDVAMGTEDENDDLAADGCTDDWVRQHWRRFQYAYGNATARMEGSREKDRRLRRRKEKDCPLLPGQRVLVRNKRLRGRQKIQDRFEATPYIVVSQPNPDIPVLVIKPERGRGPERTVHRDMLIPSPFPGQPPARARPGPRAERLQARPEDSQDDEYDEDEDGMMFIPIPAPAPVEQAVPPRRSQRANRGVPPVRRTLQPQQVCNAPTDRSSSDQEGISPGGLQDDEPLPDGQSYQLFLWSQTGSARAGRRGRREREPSVEATRTL